MLRLATGGAEGADVEWVLAFERACCPVAVTVFSFKGRTKHFDTSTHSNADITVYLMNDEEKIKADIALKLAASRLKKAMAKAIYSANLLRRNFLIADLADVMIAMGVLECELDASPTTGISVEGGTGWTCQLFANKLAGIGTPNERRFGTRALPLFLYSERHSTWAQCHVHSDDVFNWIACAQTDVCAAVKTSKVFGAIGSCVLTDGSRAAIASFVSQLLSPV